MKSVIKMQSVIEHGILASSLDCSRYCSWGVIFCLQIHKSEAESHTAFDIMYVHTFKVNIGLCIFLGFNSV